MPKFVRDIWSRSILTQYESLSSKSWRAGKIHLKNDA